MSTVPTKAEGFKSICTTIPQQAVSLIRKPPPSTYYIIKHDEAMRLLNVAVKVQLLEPQAAAIADSFLLVNLTANTTFIATLRRTDCEMDKAAVLHDQHLNQLLMRANVRVTKKDWITLGVDS